MTTKSPLINLDNLNQVYKDIRYRYDPLTSPISPQGNIMWDVFKKLKTNDTTIGQDDKGVTRTYPKLVAGQMYTIKFAEGQIASQVTPPESNIEDNDNLVCWQPPEATWPDQHILPDEAWSTSAPEKDNWADVWREVGGAYGEATPTISGLVTTRAQTFGGQKVFVADQTSTGDGASIKVSGDEDKSFVSITSSSKNSKVEIKDSTGTSSITGNTISVGTDGKTSTGSLVINGATEASGSINKLGQLTASSSTQVAKLTVKNTNGSDYGSLSSTGAVSISGGSLGVTTVKQSAQAGAYTGNTSCATLSAEGHTITSAGDVKISADFGNASSLGKLSATSTLTTTLDAKGHKITSSGDVKIAGGSLGNVTVSASATGTAATTSTTTLDVADTLTVLNAATVGTLNTTNASLTNLNTTKQGTLDTSRTITVSTKATAGTLDVTTAYLSSINTAPTSGEALKGTLSTSKTINVTGTTTIGSLQTAIANLNELAAVKATLSTDTTTNIKATTVNATTPGSFQAGSYSIGKLDAVKATLSTDTTTSINATTITNNGSLTIETGGEIDVKKFIAKEATLGTSSTSEIAATSISNSGSISAKSIEVNKVVADTLSASNTALNISTTPTISTVNLYDKSGTTSKLGSLSVDNIKASQLNLAATSSTIGVSSTANVSVSNIYNKDGNSKGSLSTLYADNIKASSFNLEASGNSLTVDTTAAIITSYLKDTKKSSSNLANIYTDNLKASSLALSAKNSKLDVTGTATISTSYLKNKGASSSALSSINVDNLTASTLTLSAASSEITTSTPSLSINSLIARAQDNRFKTFTLSNLSVNSLSAPATTATISGVDPLTINKLVTKSGSSIEVASKMVLKELLATNTSLTVTEASTCTTNSLVASLSSLTVSNSLSLNTLAAKKSILTVSSGDFSTTTLKNVETVEASIVKTNTLNVVASNAGTITASTLNIKGASQSTIVLDGATGTVKADSFEIMPKAADYVDRIRVDHELEFGYCYVYKNGQYVKATKYCQKGIIGMHSDTSKMFVGDSSGRFSFNVAVAGFVLAYIDKEYPTGTPLTTGKDGRLTKAGFFARLLHPERVVGTYWKDELEEEWGSGIRVNGRKWIKVC